MIFMHKETFEIISTEIGADENGDYLHSYHKELLESHFEIDELIAMPVQVFNRKGYRTEWCCAGHPCDIEFGVKSYIAFCKSIHFPEAPPPEFVITEREDVLFLVRKNYKGDNPQKIMSDIAKSMEILYEWALSLPDFEDIKTEVK